MRIGVSEQILRYEFVEKFDAKIDDQAAVEHLCNTISVSPEEFLVLKKKDGGFLAVLGSAIRCVETSGHVK